MSKVIHNVALAQYLVSQHTEMERHTDPETYISRCMSAGGPVEPDSHYSEYVPQLPARFQSLPELAGLDVVCVDLNTQSLEAWTLEEDAGGPFPIDN